MATSTAPRGKRKARTLAMQALYEADTVGHEPDLTLARLVAAENTPGATATFAEHLLRGVEEHQEEIDRVLRETAHSRPIEQIAPIDRGILRVALFEALFDNRAPIGAIIDEAVELAKRYGSESSSRFVNGVLGAVSGRAKPINDSASGGTHT